MSALASRRSDRKRGEGGSYAKRRVGPSGDRRTTCKALELALSSSSQPPPPPVLPSPACRSPKAAPFPALPRRGRPCTSPLPYAAERDRADRGFARRSLPKLAIKPWATPVPQGYLLKDCQVVDPVSSELLPGRRVVKIVKGVVESVDELGTDAQLVEAAAGSAGLTVVDLDGLFVCP